MRWLAVIFVLLATSALASEHVGQVGYVTADSAYGAPTTALVGGNSGYYKIVVPAAADGMYLDSILTYVEDYSGVGGTDDSILFCVMSHDVTNNWPEDVLIQGDTAGWVGVIVAGSAGWHATGDFIGTLQVATDDTLWVGALFSDDYGCMKMAYSNPSDGYVRYRANIGHTSSSWPAVIADDTNTGWTNGVPSNAYFYSVYLVFVNPATGETLRVRVIGPM